MTSSIARVLTLLFGALSATPALPALAQDLFLTNARIVDPAAQAIRQANLLILEGVITGSPERAPVGFRGQTIDLAGKWVIPGLNDMHTHAYGNMAGDAYDGPGTEVVSKRMLYAGVTGFLDLFGREDVLYRLRASQRAGQRLAEALLAERLEQVVDRLHLDLPPFRMPTLPGQRREAGMTT